MFFESILVLSLNLMPQAEEVRGWISLNISETNPSPRLQFELVGKGYG